MSENKKVVCFTAVCLFATLPAAWGQGSSPSQGKVIVPPTSIENPSDLGKRAHTNHLIFATPVPAASGPSGETPGSLGCIYQITSASLAGGCPLSTSAVPTGGSGTIAVVDAFDYPTAESDLNTFSSQFGLPACKSSGGCFKVVYASGTQPAANCGWAQESALDTQWAHAMAPGAHIVLVEAASNSFLDLLAAVDVASNEVACGDTTCPGGATGSGEVAMSWGGGEFRSENQFDSHFTTMGVVYVAASGDSGGIVNYPAVSPSVVGAGGTTINRDSSGNFASETAWSGSGGGRSRVEPIPSYQDAIANIVRSRRGSPDFSFDANPASGVSVFDSTPCQGFSGWLVFGGTSVSAPALAGIINLSGRFFSSTDLELGTIYSHMSDTSDFSDITSGRAGRFRAGPGWDFATGVGSDQGTAGK